MKKYLFILIAICISQLMALNVSAQGNAYPYCTITDASGNVFVTGKFNCSSITFGTTTLTNNGPPETLTSFGTFDMYIVKYDKDGNVKWAKSAGGTNDDIGFSIVTDGSGNVYVTGSFGSSTITFGTIVLTKAASGTNDGFIVKYDPAGNVVWAQRAGGILYDNFSKLVTDGSGNVYATGSFASSSITLGTITLINPSPGSGIPFFVKYDPSGNALWAWVWPVGVYSRDIALDGSGNLYYMGTFTTSTITFGTTTLTNSGSAGSSDIFIVKYGIEGNVLWAKSAGGSANDVGYGIATDGSGNIYVTGSFLSSIITFGGIGLTISKSGTEDMFIVKYDPSGTALWARKAGGTSVNRGYDITTDGSGNAYVTGTFVNYPIIFGTKTLPNGGAYDMFIVKYDASGNVPWAKSAGGIYNEMGLGIATDVSGNVFVTGYFTSPKITFGTITLTNTNGTNPSGYQDMFITKYDLNGNVPWAKNAGGGKSGKPKSADAGINNPPANEITIYPNPTSGKVTLSTSNSQSAITSISVFNITGKEVFSRQFSVGSQQIDVDLSSQSKGLYIVLIKAGDNYYRRKIIVE